MTDNKYWLMREADIPPSWHNESCHGAMLSTLDKDAGQYYIICWDCRRFWRTGLSDSPKHPSEVDLFKAAERIYNDGQRD